MRIVPLAFIFLAVAVASPRLLRACDVPVFRYALERWLPDEYVVLVLHDAPLTGGQAAAVKMLRDAARGSGKHTNIRVETVDVSKGTPLEYRVLWENPGDRTLPCIALRFPKSVRYEKALWRRPLSGENVRMLLDSPLRRQITEHIISGDSGVWVLRESGDRLRDNAAADTLRAALASWKYRYLPPSEREFPQTGAASAGRETAFSLVRLPHGEGGDTLLEALLLHVEPDLGEYADEPMAFPVYGRGRALYAFVGGGITVANIHKACRFMTGDCSCEVKALNPGLDLVMTADWERGIGESWIPPTVSPPLTGLPVIPAAKAKADSLLNGSRTHTATDSSSVSASAALDSGAGIVHPQDNSKDTMQVANMTSIFTPLVRNIAIAFLLVLGVAAALAFYLGAAGKKS